MVNLVKNVAAGLAAIVLVFGAGAVVGGFGSGEVPADRSEMQLQDIEAEREKPSTTTTTDRSAVRPQDRVTTPTTSREDMLQAELEASLADEELRTLLERIQARSSAAAAASPSVTQPPRSVLPPTTICDLACSQEILGVDSYEEQQRQRETDRLEARVDEMERCASYPDSYGC